MSFDIKSLNQKSTKGSKATLISVISLIVLTIIVFIYIFASSTINNKSAKIFEDAFIQILDFNDQSNVFSKQEMEEDIIYILDEVIANYSYTSSATRAVFYKGYVYYNVEKYEEATKVFTYFINKYKSNSLTEKAYYYLSYCYSATENNDKAIDTLIEFTKKYKGSYYMSMVYYRLGNLYESVDKQKAIEYYTLITSNKESSSQKSKAQKRLSIIENELKF